MTKHVTHWIDGKSYGGVAERQGDIYDPATGEVTGAVDFADVALMDEAVAAAKAAFLEWRQASLTKRSQVLFKFRELLDARKGELAEIITSEHGKVLSDALGEVTRGQEVVEFACGIPHLLKGGFSRASRLASTSTRFANRSVSSASSPRSTSPRWSRCGSSPSRSRPATPSSSSPARRIRLRRFRRRPLGRSWSSRGVFNVVHGDKVAVDRLLDHPDVKAVSFVGSTPIARYVYETGDQNGKRVQALGGAKNHMLVLPDADLDLAADQASTPGSGRRASAAWRSLR